MSDFKGTLSELKSAIDADIDMATRGFIESTEAEFGAYPAEAVRAYCELLSRGGKRIRGALTIMSYRMLAGDDQQVALQAARAIEMLHAYILMVDDIQDRSESRRGGPSAHVMLRDYHDKRRLKSDAQHFGESIAMNGFLFGAHSAINVLAQLNTDADKRLAAIENVNTYFISTAHGQTMDIFNEVVETVSEDDVDKVLLWKTAFYTFMNPLQTGAILAGATEHDLAALREYSLHAGRLFQITDDIISIFSDQSDTGKSPMDDIVEGKRTLLTVYALQHAEQSDSYFLEQKLGSRDLTMSEFKRCLRIIKDSGALEHARDQASESAELAFKVLNQAPKTWNSTEVDYLGDLTNYMLSRKA